VRGFAVSRSIHRVRLAAERDRLDSEVAFLREEIRIKDAPAWRLCRRTDNLPLPPSRAS
jgi:hypothetical protein